MLYFLSCFRNRRPIRLLKSPPAGLSVEVKTKMSVDAFSRHVLTWQYLTPPPRGDPLPFSAKRRLGPTLCQCHVVVSGVFICVRQVDDRFGLIPSSPKSHGRLRSRSNYGIRGSTRSKSETTALPLGCAPGSPKRGCQSGAGSSGLPSSAAASCQLHCGVLRMEPGVVALTVAGISAGHGCGGKGGIPQRPAPFQRHLEGFWQIRLRGAGVPSDQRDGRLCTRTRSGSVVCSARPECGDEGQGGGHHPLRGVRPASERQPLPTRRRGANADLRTEVRAGPRLHGTPERLVLRVRGLRRCRGNSLAGLLCLQRVAKELQVDLTASGSVLKRGQRLVVNCTVQGSDMVYFSWTLPRREEIEPLTEFGPNQIRSFVDIPSITLADSGVYVCAVQETLQGGRVEKSIAVNVLDRGYVSARATHDTNVSVLVGHTVALRVEVDAHPPPTVVWHKDNRSVVVLMGTTVESVTRVTDGRYVSTLSLARVRLEQTGSYAARIYNEDDQEEVFFYLQVQAPPRITSLTETGTRATLCVCEGAPPPFVTWYTCHSARGCANGTGSWTSQSGASEGVLLQVNVSALADGGLTQVRSLLSLDTAAAATLTAVRCEASNSAGRRARDLRLTSTSLLSQVAMLALVLVLVVIAIIFLVILIILWRKKPRYQVHWKLIDSVSPDGLEYTYLDAGQLPYHPSWEIPRDNIELGQVLGSGAFGRVVEAQVLGLLRDQTTTTRVAVKMVKPNSAASGSLLSELKVLCHLGPHLNIVNLLGACTSGGPVYVLTEFCCHGDLTTYLRCRKQTFVHANASAKREADAGYMDMSEREGAAVVSHHERAAADQQEALSSSSQPLLSDSTVLGVSDLHSFSFQVASAMNFLSSRNCVHRDLAARNVLVCEERLVKVGDFALARDLLKDRDYVARGNALLPLKWMSPESIFQSVYSSKSDVWSYGVLLWEIFSLGESPYSELPATQQLYGALKRGHRLAQPQHADSNIYGMMQACWSQRPGDRPSFSSLAASLDAVLTDECRKTYARLTESFLTGQHPAAVRSRLMSAAVDGSKVPEATVHLLEAGTSHGDYVLPVKVEPRGGDTAPDADRAEAAQEVTPERQAESCL
ncbi:platelet-derived growth factor receptor beta-like isoform 1-T1 [Syngnathus typhle]